MIFQRIFDQELSPQDTLLLALLDHSAISPRQFCILADWTISKLRVTVHRIRQQAEKDPDKNLWVRREHTRYELDRFYYTLGTEGLKYCGRLLQKRFDSRQIAEATAQNTHLLGLNEILVRLVKAGVNRRQIVWLATREASDFLYRLLRIKKEIKRRGILRPDARLVLGNQAFWVEYDNGTEGPLELERKMVEYIDTLEELREEWVDPHGQRRPPIDVSPVVWVARDEQRRHYLEGIWRSLVLLRYVGQWVPEMHFFSPGQDTLFFLEEVKIPNIM
jgi:hypothetical protein